MLLTHDLNQHKTKVKYYYREAKYGYCKCFVATKIYKRSLKSYKCCIGFLLPHIICKESQLLSLEMVVLVYWVFKFNKVGMTYDVRDASTKLNPVHSMQFLFVCCKIMLRIIEGKRKR